MRDFTIHSNSNGLGLQSNAIKDLCPLILHQLVIGWIGRAHGPTAMLCSSACTSMESTNSIRVDYATSLSFSPKLKCFACN